MSNINIETSTVEEDDWEEWDPSKISFLNHMVAGSMAGLAEHITIFPIDTIKTHIQCEKCGSISPFQTWACAEKIVRREGMFRLWRGVSAMFAGCVPGMFSLQYISHHFHILNLSFFFNIY